MSGHAKNGADFPKKDEAMQYVTYSAKELMYMLNDKVDRLDDKIDDLQVNFASLPAVYVTQEQITDARKESAIAKRFAIAAVIASIGSLGTFVGLLAG